MAEGAVFSPKRQTGDSQSHRTSKRTHDQFRQIRSSWEFSPIRRAQSLGARPGSNGPIPLPGSDGSPARVSGFDATGEAPARQETDPERWQFPVGEKL